MLFLLPLAPAKLCSKALWSSMYVLRFRVEACPGVDERSSSTCSPWDTGERRMPQRLHAAHCREELWAVGSSRSAPGDTPPVSQEQRSDVLREAPHPRALRNKKGWTGLRRELVSHPLTSSACEDLSGRTNRNSLLSLTVTWAEVDPNPSMRKVEVTLLAAKDPGMEPGTFFNQLQTSRPWG